MRRVAIVDQPPNGRRCIAVFQWERGDFHGASRPADLVFNFGDRPQNDVWEEGSRLGLAPPFLPSSSWAWLFMFSDGRGGICRDRHLSAALASCGLRLIEGGE